VDQVTKAVAVMVVIRDRKLTNAKNQNGDNPSMNHQDSCG
jgi:hypothetical protein